MALKINDENAKELIASGKPVVIDFWGNLMLKTGIIKKYNKEWGFHYAK
jgi:hypothetical protein